MLAFWASGAPRPERQGGLLIPAGLGEGAGTGARLPVQESPLGRGARERWCAGYRDGRAGQRHELERGPGVLHGPIVAAPSLEAMS